MSYNILKIMKSQQTGKVTHVLLTDGLSQILDFKNLKKALKFTELLNENSDSGWIYQVRGDGKIINTEKEDK